MAAEGVESRRGGPCRGGPTRYSHRMSCRVHRLHDLSTSEAQRWCSKLNNDVAGPTTNGYKPNDDAVSWTMTWQAQWWWYKPNNDTASWTTTLQAQQWQHRPKNDTASPTTTWQAQRQCSELDDNVASPMTRILANDDAASSMTMWQAHQWCQKPPPLYSQQVCWGLFFWHHSTNMYVLFICAPVATSCMFLKYIYFTAKHWLRPVKTSHEPDHNRLKLVL